MVPILIAVQEMPSPKLNKIIKYLPFIVFILSLFFIVKTLFLDFYPDFKIHFLAPQEILHGINPYLGGKEYFTPDVHPPFAILIFTPFILFSFEQAEKLWTLLSITLFSFSIYLIFKINKAKMFSAAGLYLCALTFAFYFPAKFTFGMGQINTLLLFLTVLSIYSLNKNKDYLSGVFLSLSVMIKFFPLMFLPYLIIFKKWKMLISFLITSLVILFVTLVFIKPNINIYFYKDVLPTLIGGWKTEYYNQSLSGFLGRLMDNGYQREMLRIFISSALILISFLVIIKNNSKKTNVINLILSLLVTLTLLINNFSWQHHFIWLIFPFITIFYFVKNEKLNWKYYSLLVLSFVLVSFNIKNPNLINPIFISHVFYGTLILWGLNLYLLFRKSAN